MPFAACLYNSVTQAYYIPVICYFVIFLFEAKFYRVQSAIVTTNEKKI